VRVSATVSTTTGAVATTGTVTSVFAADLRATLTGAASTAATGATSGFLAVFFSAGMFELTVDFTEGISNAVGILLCILTCLNHNLCMALIIMKQTAYGSGKSFKMVVKTLEDRYDRR